MRTKPTANPMERSQRAMKEKFRQKTILMVRILILKRKAVSIILLKKNSSKTKGWI